MKAMETMLAEAIGLDRAGEKGAALSRYSDAFNSLVTEAAEYAQMRIGAVADQQALRALTPQLLHYSKEFLARELTAATILNAMGVLFGELGEYDNAKQKFIEAIDCIPSDSLYTDPQQNLEELQSRMIDTIVLEDSDE